MPNPQIAEPRSGRNFSTSDDVLHVLEILFARPPYRVDRALAIEALLRRCHPAIVFLEAQAAVDNLTAKRIAFRRFCWDCLDAQAEADAQ